MKNTNILGNHPRLHVANAALAVFLAFLAGARTGFADSTNYVFTAEVSNSAWLTAGNWSPSGPPGTNDVAQFDTNAPTSSKGSQINFSNPVNNGADNETVGAIQVLPTRTSSNLPIGNGSGSVNGILTLNGATVNGFTNVIIENGSPNTVTIQNVGNGGSATITMGLALGNTNENVISLDNSGGIVISSSISSSGNLRTPLTVTGTAPVGSHDGSVEITGVNNTWTGDIQVTGSEIDISADGSLGNILNNITINGGRFGIANDTAVTISSSRSIFLGNNSVGVNTGTSITTLGGSGVLTYNGVMADVPGSMGTLVKQGAGTLALGGMSTFSGNISINNGVLQLITGGNRLPTGATVYFGQTLNLGTFDLNGYNQQIEGLDSTSGGNTNDDENMIINSADTTATLTLSNLATDAFGDGSTTNSGIITDDINLVENGPGTQILGDINTYTGTTTVNAGTLALTGVGSIGDTPEITVAAGASLDVSARTDGTLTLGDGQQLDGFGTVAGMVAASDGSTLAPGSSTTIGTLTVSSDVTLNGTAMLKINQAGRTNDVLSAGGALTLGGTLIVTNLSGTLAAGDQFRLFNAPSIAGSFSETNLPALSGNLFWDTSRLTNGILDVANPVPYLAIKSFSLSGTNLVMGGTNQGTGTYFVLASTNLALPLTNWTAIATRVLSGNFSLTVTNAINPKTPREFYILGATNNN